MAWGSGDWFIDLFTAEAEKLIEILARKRSTQLPSTSSWWVAGLPSPAEKNKPVAAVDGGGGIQPLAGGGSIYVVRAYGFRSWAEPKRGLELRYYPVRDVRVLDALRSWLEHRIALAIVADAPRDTIVLMDGSLWALIAVSISSLARVAVSEPSGVGSIYSALLSLYTLTTIAELVDLALKRNILVAYISKDHSYRFLKERVLLGIVAEKWPKTREVVEKALAWYPLAERDLLLKARREAPDENTRQLIDASLDPSYRDTAFIEDVVGPSIGYTIPLTIPPPLKAARLILRHGVRGVVEAVCRRVEDYLGSSDAAECWGSSSRFISAIDSLPRVLGSYLKLSPSDTPLLVEVPSKASTFFSPGREFIEPSRDFETIASMLVRDYAGPQYYNIPLITAHASATLTRRHMESYIRLLEGLAAAHGVKLRLARRTLIARHGRRSRVQHIP